MSGRLLCACLLAAAVLLAAAFRSRRTGLKRWRRNHLPSPALERCPPARKGFEGFPEYKRGVWIRHDLSFEAAARLPNRICCRHRNFHPEYPNPRECYQGANGQWKNLDNLADMQPGQVASTSVAGNCDCRLNFPDVHISGRVVSPVEWTWRPFGQQDLKAAWDTTHFCQLLGHRVLIMVGDSTMHQSWTAVVNTVSQTGGACYKTIVWKKSYDLAPAEVIRKTDDPKPYPKDVSLDKHLNELVNNKSASAVIVVGTAAHHNTWQRYNATLDWVVGYLEEHKTFFAHGERLRMLWNTAYAPHYGCHNEREPAIYGHGFKRQRTAHPAFGFWNNVEAYDEVAVERLGRSGLVSTIVDMTPTYLRGDAHSIDCLHACVNEMTGSAVEILAYKLYDALRCPDKVLV